MKIINYLILIVLILCITSCDSADGILGANPTLIIDSSGGDGGSRGNWWDSNWSNRTTITIDNSANASDLTDYQVMLTIDNSHTDFWTNIESDGRSIRIIDTNDSTELDFWVEKFDFGGNSSYIWIDVPLIEANSAKDIYIYYTNNATTSNSNGENVFIFFDDFEDGDSSDWTTYSSGNVQIQADPDTPAGRTSTLSLQKYNQSDPHGAWVPIGSTIGLGYILDGRVYRPSSYGGGGSDRFAVEDSSFNGYGPIMTRSSSTVGIEKRTGGSGAAIGSSESYTMAYNQWFIFSFIMKSGGSFDLLIYDLDYTLGHSVLARTDSSYTNFDRITIHGGYEFYMDDLRIRLYTDPEPTVTMN